MTTLNKLVFAGTMTILLAGAASAATGNPKIYSMPENRVQAPRDPYTYGGRIDQRDVFTDGARVGQRYVFTDGARSMVSSASGQ